LRAAAAADGIALVLTSAHRDPRAQRALFRSRLGGRTSDAAIAAVLATAAPPGYSKHHSGYAIDVGQAGTSGSFATTAAYRWLAADDFVHARDHGWVPSFPAGGTDMGPDPEAWEFVWVGRGRLACSDAGASTMLFCDTAATPWDDDVAALASAGVVVGCEPGRFCVDDPVTRGEAASMLWRLHGAPEPAAPAPFLDVYVNDHFADAVAWLWQEGLTDGTSPATFSPDRLLTGAEAPTRLVRLGERPRPDLVDVALTGGAAVDPGSVLTRGEFAGVLRGLAAAR